LTAWKDELFEVQQMAFSFWLAGKRKLQDRFICTFLVLIVNKVNKKKDVYLLFSYHFRGLCYYHFFINNAFEIFKQVKNVNKIMSRRLRDFMTPLLNYIYVNL